MLDACPHHHEDDQAALAELSPRTPGAAKAKKFWRSLDELAQTPAFLDMLHREFPFAASEWKDGSSRRSFLKLMGASLALGGLSACTLRKTQEKIVPYVNPPEEVIPGRPLFFASSVPWSGYAKGVIVESHEGRPTKIEGNPDHPASLGAADIWGQASVLDMYDPDRSQVVLNGQGVSTWGDLTLNVGGKIAEKMESGGERVRFLTGAVTSPTFARQMEMILKKMPKARWHQYEVMGRRNIRQGAIDAFGRDAHAVYRFDQAQVIVSLDSNFLTDDPGSLTYSRRFVDGRRFRKDAQDKMNRMYAVESTVTLTGAMADHRLALRSTDIESFARTLAAALSGVHPEGPQAKWIQAVADDLRNNRGKSLIVVGESQPPSVHAWAHLMNHSLGNVGHTLDYVEPIEAAGPDGPHSLEELVQDMMQSNVDLLFIFGTNPVYTAPPELGLSYGLWETDPKDRSEEYIGKNPLARVKTVVHHGMYGPAFDETAFFNTWHIPASHYLEAWGDLRAFDGTASIIQPLIYPLYSSKSEIEVLNFVIGQFDPPQLDRSAYETVRDTWRSRLPAPADANWQRALEKGVIPGTAATPISLSLSQSLPPTSTPAAGAGTIEIVFRPDPSVWDGRFANNAWLQELPKPLTSLTWDNAALMSMKTAQNLGVSQENPGRPVEASVVQIKFGSRMVKLPALVMPGHADDSITVCLGYGRARAGSVGCGIGVNAYYLRSTSDTWFGGAAEVTVTADTYPLATTQMHHLMEAGAKPSSYDSDWLAERELIHTFTVEEARAKQREKISRSISLPLAKEDEPEQLIPDWPYTQNKWAMVIDNNACIGCNACVVACQSENNIPVVGKEQVLNDREMHWLRIDTYFQGEADGTPDTYFQPIPCMQCETAPCTLVCPVEATTISAEGINEQTYNRCVGTRYCSNNCPYKVRRFNFLFYNDYSTQSLMLQKNPNVTVRGRGVMEKCNYCVQRVNNGRIEAKKQDRPIAPGEVVPACAQSCPTQAIIFGNLNDPRWDVVALQEEPLRYTLLDELDTKPRTSYLAKIKNPNPALSGGSA